MAELHDRVPAPDARRVVDILDPADAARALDLPPFEPRDELMPALRRGRRGAYRSAADVDALLSAYLDDALAGVPDRLIARRTGLSAQQVKLWRARRGIAGRRGRAPVELGTRFLVSALLGEETTPVPHEFSPVQGAWRPPAYALRRPLDYRLFARVVSRLVDELTVDQIASAIGIDERDIEMAIRIEAARGDA